MATVTIIILVLQVKKRGGAQRPCWSPARYSDKAPEQRGELWTIQFPAHAEIPLSVKEVVPGEHTAPCSACDNLHFKAPALDTLFAWVHVGTANCLWAAAVCKAPLTP